MGKVSFGKAKIVERLTKLTMASESIQSTANMFMQNKKFAPMIVDLWFEAIKRVSSEQKQLNLFYLANEILQTCKKCHAPEFKTVWRTCLPKALKVLEGSSVCLKYQRILKIWKERNVYDASFMDDLLHIMGPIKKETPESVFEPSPDIEEDGGAVEDPDVKTIEDFNPEEALDRIRQLLRLEQETQLRSNQLRQSSRLETLLDPTNLWQLKDIQHGRQFTKQLEDWRSQLEDMCDHVSNEMDYRKQQVVKVLEQAEIFYYAQCSDAAVVVKAYSTYGGRIKRVKTSLEEHLDFLPEDLVPSVDLEDAPSPGNTPPHLRLDMEDLDSYLIPSDQDAGDDMDVSDGEDHQCKAGSVVKSRTDRPYSPSEGHQARNTLPLQQPSSTTISQTHITMVTTTAIAADDAKMSQIVSGYRPPPRPSLPPPPPAPPTSSQPDSHRDPRVTLPPPVDSSDNFNQALNLVSNLSGLSSLLHQHSHQPPPPPPPPPSSSGYNDLAHNDDQGGGTPTQDEPPPPPPPPAPPSSSAIDFLSSLMQFNSQPNDGTDTVTSSLLQQLAGVAASPPPSNSQFQENTSSPEVNQWTNWQNTPPPPPPPPLPSSLARVRGPPRAIRTQRPPANITPLRGKAQQPNTGGELQAPPPPPPINVLTGLNQSEKDHPLDNSNESFGDVDFRQFNHVMPQQRVRPSPPSSGPGWPRLPQNRLNRGGFSFNQQRWRQPFSNQQYQGPRFYQ